MNVDYIIVGFGLAGMSMAETLLENNKSFVVISDDSQRSSRVAAGVFNPVILKRFTPVWNADQQLDILHPFYDRIEKRLDNTYKLFFETKKVFKTVEDQNNWFKATDNPVLEHHLQTKIETDPIPGIIHHNGFGKVKSTGRILINNLLNDYIEFLKKQEMFRSESFDYDCLSFEETISYKDVSAKRVVFCEGYGLHKNPFFNELPLMGTKGELMTIKAADLKLKDQIKSSVFVLPMGDDLYWVGATFNWTDKTSVPTEEGRKELIEKLETVIDVPYEIIEQTAGIRPTVKDRRPLLGKHPEYSNLYVFNGLGTRGVMIAPSMAQLLYESIEINNSLPKDVDIIRYNNVK